MLKNDMVTRQLSLCAALTMFFFSLTTLAGPRAFAASPHLNRAGALSYARQWVMDINSPSYKKLRNLNYPSYSADCTNFVSQSWAPGGGLPYDSTIVNEWSPGFPTWSVAVKFSDYFTQAHAGLYGSAAVWQRQTQFGSGAFNSATAGDAILYDWGKGQGWSHLAIELGVETYFAAYAGDNGGSGDAIAQHVTDRKDAPWNYGYLHPDTSIDRTHMAIGVIHYINGL